MNRAHHTEDRIHDGPEADVAEHAHDVRSSASLTLPELLRFTWRQLTSMRTALFLLMLLAIASVPGSLFPQVGFDAAGVAQFLRDNSRIGPWLQRLQFFEVYSSVWFSAIYLLLFISLIGCIVPRALVHARAVRAQPPRTPSRLSRLPEYRTLRPTAPAEEIFEGASTYLRRRRFRVDVRPQDPEGASTGRSNGEGSVAAERGHHRETGNVVFHLSLIGLLISFASTSLYSFSGQRLVVEGDTFVGSATDFDSFSAGAFADEDQVPRFSLTLDNMDVAFEAEQATQIGQPRQFAADVQLSPADGSTSKQRIEVNRPADIDGTQISLSGNGYAPVLTVRDGQGTVVSEGSVPFLPQTGNYDSSGVVKLPDVVDAQGASQQVGLQGVFLPTATVDAANRPVSGFPGLGNPVLVFTVWVGDLGLESGVPQSVYELDNTSMAQALDEQGRPLALQLTPGETVQLPDGLGSVTLEAVARFAAFDVRRTPGQVPALVFSSSAAAGLIASLFLPRRRVWMRLIDTPRQSVGHEVGRAVGRQVVAPDGDAGPCVLEVAGLSRGSDAGLADEVDQLCAFLIQERLAARTAAGLRVQAEERPFVVGGPAQQEGRTE